MRTISVVTVGRSDYGIYTPVLRRIRAHQDLRLRLLVTGTHLLPEFGKTIRAIEADGYEIAERIDMLLASDAPEGIAQSMGLGMMGFAQAFRRCRPEVLLVLGDRFEMFAAAAAALPFKIPVAHLHGGELTEGAIDDALRHSMTKLSHLHFVATDEAARRVLQLGEEPWRVLVTGAAGLDNVREIQVLDQEQLARQHGLHITPETLLVTFHPVTLEYEQTEWQVGELLAALEACGRPLIFTVPNADTSGRLIRRLVEAFVREHPQSQLIEHLGTQAYFSLMAIAAALVGNSSSGLIEAPSSGLPVVNVGTRQQGRQRGENVIDVDYPRADVLRGIRQAVAPEFRARLVGLANPYGDGYAAERIVRRLKDAPLDQRLLIKRWCAPAVESPDGAHVEECGRPLAGRR